MDPILFCWRIQNSQLAGFKVRLFQKIKNKYEVSGGFFRKNSHNFTFQEKVSRSEECQFSKTFQPQRLKSTVALKWDEVHCTTPANALVATLRILKAFPGDSEKKIRPQLAGETFSLKSFLTIKKNTEKSTETVSLESSYDSEILDAFESCWTTKLMPTYVRSPTIFWLP